MQINRSLRNSWYQMVEGLMVKSAGLDLEAFAGCEAEPVRVARYAVDEAMIRNWVEAHDDRNPVYVNDDAARSTGRRGIVCPPAMVSTWVMNGYRRFRQVQDARARGEAEGTAYSRLMAELDTAGFTSVVGTNVQQRYARDLHIGDRLTCHYTIDSISSLKKTALGEGHFVTLGKRYIDQNGDTVAEEKFRMLRFRPETGDAA